MQSGDTVATGLRCSAEVHKAPVDNRVARRRAHLDVVVGERVPLPDRVDDEVADRPVELEIPSARASFQIEYEPITVGGEPPPVAFIVVAEGQRVTSQLPLRFCSPRSPMDTPERQAWRLPSPGAEVSVLPKAGVQNSRRTGLARD